MVLADADDVARAPQSLLAHADIALYEAKARDKGGIVRHRRRLERAAAAKQVHLREQIAQPGLDDFRVVYQPIVDLVTGEMRGVEALLRWQHPELGAVPPADFIPMAEHGGSIQTLGWFVLEESCRQLAALAAGAPRPAARDRRQRLGPAARRARVRRTGRSSWSTSHGSSPDQVVLELTEQSLAVDFETAVARGRRSCAAAGVSVAVDDYGTGYSSLRYLHRFAADVVKIDRSFVANARGQRAHRRSSSARSTHMAEVAGPAVDRGGHRDPRAARACVAGPRLRAGAGLPVLPAGPARADQRHVRDPVRRPGRVVAGRRLAAAGRIAPSGAQPAEGTRGTRGSRARWRTTVPTPAPIAAPAITSPG